MKLSYVELAAKLEELARDIFDEPDDTYGMLYDAAAALKEAALARQAQPYGTDDILHFADQLCIKAQTLEDASSTA